MKNDTDGVSAAPPCSTALRIEAMGPVDLYSDVATEADDKSEILITGDVYRLTIERHGQSQFGISIQSDGTVHLTDYSGMNFVIPVGSQLQVQPRRPWQ